MSFSTDIYKAIQADVAENRNVSGLQAMRKITEKNGIDIVFAIHVNSGMRAVYFCVGKRSAQKAFPKWKGIDIQIVKLPAYGNDCNYVALTQLPLSEGYIFEIVVEDLRLALAAASLPIDALWVIYTILAKWKDFFQADKELLLSSERQQGLYGELLFLEECIEQLGSSAVLHWAGCDNETHDFYIASDAVEVKTTGMQEPYYAHISSEYQLDNSDVPGKLFLRFFAFRKSQSSGERLPDVVKRIRQKLILEQNMLQQFNAKVQKYGYFDEVAELYVTGYFVRDQYYFVVDNGFPRITKQSIPSGVTDLTYLIGVAQCVVFAAEKTEVFGRLKGGAADA